MLNNQEFFHELSVQYDSMIPVEEAIKRKDELFKNLIKNSPKKMPIKDAVQELIH